MYKAVKVQYVSPDERVAFLTSPTQEDIARHRCVTCPWRNTDPEVCRICKQDQEQEVK